MNLNLQNVQTEKLNNFLKKNIKSNCSFISGISQISSFIAGSELQRNKIYYISNPLVIIVGIGNYDSGVMPSLIGVNQDYANIIFTFYHKFGYSVLYKNKNNECVYKKDKNKEQVSIHQLKGNVKIHWNSDELEDFFTQSTNYVESNKHDSCIFIISSHGEAEGVIIDSEGEEYSLEFLFYQYMGNSCEYLVDKPKLFFVDACRGKLRANLVKSQNNSTSMDSGSKNTKMNSNTAIQMVVVENDDEKKCSSNDRKMVADELEWKEKDMIKINNASYHPRANFTIVYANPEGYAAGDGGIKGGYLIRAMTRIFSTLDVSLNDSLDTLVVKIRNQSKEMAGTGAVQCVEHVSSMTYDVMFLKRN